jgi:hypothetical protein
VPLSVTANRNLSNMMKIATIAAAAVFLICCGLAYAETKAPQITNAQALSLLSALRNLDGHIVVIKQAGQDQTVMVPWEFGSGTLRLRIASNVTALVAVEKSVEDARQSIVKEVLSKMPAAEDGKPRAAIPNGSPEFDVFQKQYADMMNAPAQVTLARIKASELKLDKNEIPVTALSALVPILDDDVSPK